MKVTLNHPKFWSLITRKHKLEKYTFIPQLNIFLASFLILVTFLLYVGPATFPIFFLVLTPYITRFLLGHPTPSLNYFCQDVPDSDNWSTTNVRRDVYYEE